MRTWYILLCRIITISTQIDLLRQTFVTILTLNFTGTPGLSVSAGAPTKGVKHLVYNDTGETFIAYAVK
jgi:hypothetical protein